jgi:hypothetical protein
VKLFELRPLVTPPEIAKRVLAEAARDAEHSAAARRWLKRDGETLRLWLSWMNSKPPDIRLTDAA